MNCPIAMWLGYFSDLPIRESIARLAAAGFTVGDLSDEHTPELMSQPDPVSAARDLRAYADDLGFSIPQGHLSFKQGLCTPEAVDLLKREIDMFAALGTTALVIHGSGGLELSREQRTALWAKNLGILSEYVEGSGITLCLENLYSLAETRTCADLKAILEASGGKNLGICLDTGHLHLCRRLGYINETPAEFIRSAGPLLQALHINDNDGLGDTHHAPFSALYGISSLRWKEVMQALHDIDYRGIFDLELLAEGYGPLPIRTAKLAYLRTLSDYLLSPEFLNM